MNDLHFIREALSEARTAYDTGEMPVGAVIVRAGVIISRAHNETTPCSDPTAHAEICAIRRACKSLGRLKLIDCDLYTTLYPCPMCEMVIKEVQLARVVYGGNPYRKTRNVACGVQCQ